MRLLILKHVRNWSYEALEREVRAIRIPIGEQARRSLIVGSATRGAGSLLTRFVDKVPVNAVGLDWTVDRGFVRERVQNRVAVQGNVDPLALHLVYWDFTRVGGARRQTPRPWVAGGWRSGRRCSSGFMSA